MCPYHLFGWQRNFWISHYPEDDPSRGHRCEPDILKILREPHCKYLVSVPGIITGKGLQLYLSFVLSLKFVQLDKLKVDKISVPCTDQWSGSPGESIIRQTLHSLNPNVVHQSQPLTTWLRWHLPWPCVWRAVAAETSRPVSCDAAPQLLRLLKRQVVDNYPHSCLWGQRLGRWVFWMPLKFCFYPMNIERLWRSRGRQPWRQCSRVTWGATSLFEGVEHETRHVSAHVFGGFRRRWDGKSEVRRD